MVCGHRRRAQAERNGDGCNMTDHRATSGHHKRRS
jgi:hypothetical protein